MKQQGEKKEKTKATLFERVWPPRYIFPSVEERKSLRSVWLKAANATETI